ncbi:uncharacterized protein LOC143221887 isoform X2 [Lasioglossum baleicum]|uniref:uncharacterized protein LOC143221887 isoform X2 n=1 Tax=Lasioglossum baleicum TaxID=434251 RepID=UPI003FCD24B6
MGTRLDSVFREAILKVAWDKDQTEELINIRHGRKRTIQWFQMVRSLPSLPSAYERVHICTYTIPTRLRGRGRKTRMTRERLALGRNILITWKPDRERESSDLSLCLGRVSI